MSSPMYYKERLKHDLAREIGWTIANRVRDPRIPSIVTVTEVRLSADTRNATVFVSVFGEDVVKTEALAALQHAAPFIQNRVAEKVKMKNFPRLHFKLDRSLDQSERINELLDEVKDDLDRS